jgi:hypothetical protein
MVVIMSEEFLLGTEVRQNASYIRVKVQLGALLMRPEIDEIVGAFGSDVQRNRDFTELVNIVPPLDDAQLELLGERLVELAVNLNPSPPAPTYKVEK